MSNSMTAIYDDIARYEALCERYGEKPVSVAGGRGPDPYGPHAKSLEERRQKEHVQ